MLMLKQQDQTIIIAHFKSYSEDTQDAFVFNQFFKQKEIMYSTRDHY